MTTKEPTEQAGYGRTLAVGALLLLLWGLSLGLSFVQLGAAALPLALAIAAAKAILVVWIFMELCRESPSIVFAFALGWMMVVFLMAFVVADVLTRTPPPLAPF